MVLALICGIGTLLAGIFLTAPYLRAVAADEATARAGIAYLYAYTPGLALQFAMIALSSALRGTGIVQPTMLVQMLTVVVNIVLAPRLIAGWGTHPPLGPAGAGLASSIAVAVGVVLLWIYFARLEHYVGFSRTLWRPQWPTIRSILNIGLPAGGEFFMMFVILGVIYLAIRSFGPEAQAGFGIGGRMMQALFLPVMALAFGATPLAGQNFGARQFGRVRQRHVPAGRALEQCSHAGADPHLPGAAAQFFIRLFGTAQVVAVGADYLRIISWNFIATGLIFTCSGMFQALGNTWPSLLSSGSRLITFVLPVLWLSMRPGFTLTQVWHLSVVTVALQALTSLFLLRRQFRQRLQESPAAAALPLPPEPEAPTSTVEKSDLPGRYLGSCPGCGSDNGKVLAAPAAGALSGAEAGGAAGAAPAADAVRVVPVLALRAAMKRRAMSSFVVTLPLKISAAPSIRCL